MRTAIGGRARRAGATVAPAPVRPPPRWPDVAGVAWVVAAGVLVLVPALVHGSFLGSYDWLTQFGLSAQPGAGIHNSVNLDQIDFFIPLTSLAWTQVHHGHLPLWNPYSALGMPLAFNWQSAPFSLPSVVGYLVPITAAYTTGMVVTLVVAGTGVYVLGRVLRLGVIGSALAATVFELSGPLMGWLGWSFTSVMSWSGWLFAAAILVVRGRHRAGAIGALAVVLALAIYAGQPETLLMLVLALLVFVLVLLLRQVRRQRDLVRRGARDVALGLVAGALLGAPLLLPGVQILRLSKRSALHGGQALPLHDLTHLLFQSFDGSPLAGGLWFGSKNYVETAGYLGVIPLVLVVVALGRRVRDPEVLALGAVALVNVGLVFVPPVVRLADDLPLAGSVLWYRALLPLAFALAVLAGVGTDVVVKHAREGPVRLWAGAGFAAAAVVLALLWTLGRGQLPPAEAHIRARSFLWPALETVVGLVVVVALMVAARRRRPAPGGGPARWRAGSWAGAVLLVGAAASLFVVEAPLTSSSPSGLVATRAERALSRAVGTAVVGVGAGSCWGPPALGILPNANVALGVDEFAIYDPAVPWHYYASWQRSTGQPGGPSLPLNLFCPSVTTVSAARLFGVAYVLEVAGTPGPPGAVAAGRVGDEDLYRVPGAALATVVPLGRHRSLPPDGAPGRALALTRPTPSSVRVVTDSRHGGVLRLRLADVPGWHATLDGRPLPLHPFSRIMLQARVPPGRHTVELTYLPTAFTWGLVLAAVAVVALVTGVALDRRRRRRRTPAGAPLRRRRAHVPAGSTGAGDGDGPRPSSSA